MGKEPFFFGSELPNTWLIGFKIWLIVANPVHNISFETFVAKIIYALKLTKIIVT